MRPHALKGAASAAVPDRESRVASLLRVVAAGLSAGAALVSILSYTGARAADAGAEPPPAARAHRLTLSPASDTAAALGDSLPLAALVTDDRGAALLGVAPAWTTADPSVATVDSSGTVVAHGPGSTVIIVGVGALEARSRIVVAQTPAGLRAHDSLLRVPEGETALARLDVLDARGHGIAAAPVRWTSVDPSVAAVDTAGTVQGVSPGRGALVATLGALRAELPVEVLPVPASITVLDGEDQRAAAGTALRLPVVGQVVSRSGRPVAGIEVAFLPRAAGGATQPAVDTSDARGTVSAVWTLDAVPGRQQLALAVAGVPISPVVSAEADPDPANTRVAPAADEPVGTAGEPLPEPVAIRVTDSAGMPLSDLPVGWTTPDGGEVAAEGTRTDSLGSARARWTLGRRAGSQRLRAQVGNPRTLPAIVLTARALPGPAASLAARSGDGQRAAVGSRLPRPLVVRVLDRGGNPVPGAAVHARAAAGRLADTLVRTDSAGQARFVWTLGTAAGAQRVMLRLDGGPTLELTARAAPGPAAKLAFVGAPAALTVGRPLDSLVVEAQDAHGNPVPGIKVALASTRGTLTPARAATDARGRARARWAPGRKAGPVTLTASAGALRATRTVTLRPAP